ncbi:HEAT repeat domain-containing protein [Nitrospirota bacterium]
MEKSEEKSVEGKAAAEAINAFIKAKKNLRLYPSNNPMYSRIVQESYHKTVGFFNYQDEMKLMLTRNEIYLGEEVIYSGEGKDENMALFFFRDGLRSLTFERGLESQELQDFLNILSVDFDSDEVEEDIVTLLWEKDFGHIKYTVDENVLVEDESFQDDAIEHAKEQSPSEDELSSAYEEVLKEEEEAVTINPIIISEKDLAMLSSEIAKIDEDKLPKLLDVLFHMLFSSAGMDEFKDVVRILMNAVEYAIKDDNLSGAIMIFSRVNELSGRTRSDEAKKQLQKLFAFAASPAILKRIGARLETRESIEEKEFNAYVDILDDTSIPGFIELLGELQSINGRKLVISALSRLGKDNLPLLAKGLEDKRWFVVRNIILVLREIGDKRAMNFLVKYHEHEDVRVRREVIKSLGDMGGKGNDEIAAIHLFEDDHVIGIVSAQALAKIKTELGRQSLLKKITDKKMQEEEIGIMKKYFEALAYFGYDRVADDVMDIIKKNPIFGRARYNEYKACAIFSLGLMGNPESLDTLEELTESKTKMIADYAGSAIKRIKYARKG